MKLGALARAAVLALVGAVVAALAIIGGASCIGASPEPGPAERAADELYLRASADGVVSVEEAAELAQALAAMYAERRARPPEPALPDLGYLFASILAAATATVPVVNVWRNHNLPGSRRVQR